MIRYSVLFPVILSFFLSACGGDDRLNVDVSDIEVDMDLKRLDRDLFEPGLDSMSQVNQQLMDEYGGFYTTYLQKILREGSPYDPMIGVRLEGFTEDIHMRETYEMIKKVYPSMEPYMKEFRDAFRHYEYYYPDSVVPDIITYHSGFNYGIYPTDSILGIGLEWYLGSDNEITKRLPVQSFPNYKKEKMDPQYLVTDAVKGYLKFKMRSKVREAETLLDHMVFYGKVLYMTDALMPDTPDSLKINYSSREIAWAREFEDRVWKELVDKDILFTKEEKVIRKMIQDGPFTTMMPRESPPMLGKFLGWQMVRSFMIEHPEMSIHRMLAIENSQMILKYYKPKMVS